MDLGAQVPDEVLEHRISQLAPNKCCTLIYTVLLSSCSLLCFLLLLSAHPIFSMTCLVDMSYRLCWQNMTLQGFALLARLGF